MGRIRYRFALEVLPRPDSNGGRLLDIGGGRAEFARLARDMGWQVTLAEGNPDSVVYAQNLGFEAHQLDLNRGLELPGDSRFSGAVCLDVIEHVVCAEFLLKEIARVLSPGGFLVISSPNISYWEHRLNALRGRIPHGEGYHYRFFNPIHLERTLSRAGFWVESWNSFVGAFMNRVRNNGRPKYNRIPPSRQVWAAGTLVARARLL